MLFRCSSLRATGSLLSAPAEAIVRGPRGAQRVLDADIRAAPPLQRRPQVAELGVAKEPRLCGVQRPVSAVLSRSLLSTANPRFGAQTLYVNCKRAQKCQPGHTWLHDGGSKCHPELRPLGQGAAAYLRIAHACRYGKQGPLRSSCARATAAVDGRHCSTSAPGYNQGHVA